jgi:hypothetical protein
VFAPHYAAPVRCSVASGANLRERRGVESPTLATLPAGAAFDVLEITAGVGWGIAVDDNLVGYVDTAALAAPGSRR